MVLDTREIVRDVVFTAVRLNNIDLSKCYFHFQPIFCLKTDMLVMYEVLLRLDDPRFESIEDLVIELISIGQEDQLTMHTLNALKPYLLSPRYAHNTFTINLEPAQIASPNVVGIITAFFLAYGIERSRIIFEITERPCSKESFAALTINTNLMAAKGYRFAIDDFGSGVANFELLIALDVELIKLDSMFSIGALNSGMIKKVLAMASTFKNDFGCRVCIEGLESEELIALAKHFDFCYGQGYGLGYPGLLELE